VLRSPGRIACGDCVSGVARYDPGDHTLASRTSRRGHSGRAPLLGQHFRRANECVRRVGRGPGLRLGRQRLRADRFRQCRCEARAPDPGGRGVSSITAGITYTCAVLLNGDVHCWGRDLFGEALHTLNSRVGRVRAIAVGTHATWVLDDPGSGWSSGSAHPVSGGGEEGTVNPGLRAETVAAGLGPACALGREGAVRWWGGTLFGQLGTGVGSSSVMPVRVFPRS
jgi:alpha-tubulin suppressor-like RCC1 family protein